MTPSKSCVAPSRAARARSSPSTAEDGAFTSKKSSEIRPTVSSHLIIFVTLNFLALGQQAQIPIHPSNCVVTQLKLDKDRKALLERKKRVTKQKNKHREGAAAGLD
mgnify:CR=1 FL=1